MSPHSTSEALLASGPLLVNYELVGFSEEDLGGKVPTQFATEGALNSDGLKGELPDAGWNVAAALLAGHHEALPISGHWEHGSMVGECKANVQTARLQTRRLRKSMRKGI